MQPLQRLAQRVEPRLVAFLEAFQQVLVPAYEYGVFALKLVLELRELAWDPHRRLRVLIPLEMMLVIDPLSVVAVVDRS